MVVHCIARGFLNKPNVSLSCMRRINIHWECIWIFSRIPYSMHDVCPWPKKWRMSILPLLWYLKSSYRHNIGRERTRAQKKVLLISSLCPVLAKMCQGYKTPLLMPLDFVSQIRVIKICINNAISHKNSAIFKGNSIILYKF